MSLIITTERQSTRALTGSKAHQLKQESKPLSFSRKAKHMSLSRNAKHMNLPLRKIRIGIPIGNNEKHPIASHWKLAHHPIGFDSNTYKIQKDLIGFLS